MFAKEVISVKPITNLEAKTHLENIQKDLAGYEIPLSYEQEKSLNYLKKHTPFTEKQEKEIKLKLLELGLPENIVVELINSHPKQEETIKAILFKRFDANEETLKKIGSILSGK